MPEGANYTAAAVVELVATDSGDRWVIEIGDWSRTDRDSETITRSPRAVRAAVGSPTHATISAPVDDLARWAWTRGGTVHIDGSANAQAAVARLIGAGIQ